MRQTKSTHNKTKLHPQIRKLLGYGPRVSDAWVLSDWKKKSSFVCKPCWELKYCPYGYLTVFARRFAPALPFTRAEAEKDQLEMKESLRTGKYPWGERLDKEDRVLYREWIKSYDPNIHPIEIPQVIKEMECRLFGNICPVVFVAVEFNETMKCRRRGRYNSMKVKMRVVRRDNYTCQRCGKHLNDNELEFDHEIPLSKGGSSEESNIRLTCFKCNRDKSDRMEL